MVEQNLNIINFLENKRAKFAPEIIYDYWSSCGSHLIYRATCLENGKEYFGQTINTLQYRINGHITGSKSGRCIFLRALKKHGVDKFLFEKWDYAFSAVELNEKEKFWIRKHKTNFLSKEYEGVGYNSTDGGDINPMLGRKHTPETLEIFKKQRSGRKLSKSWRKNLSKSKKGRPSIRRGVPNYALRGRKRTPEARAKMSLAKKGKKMSPEFCALQSKLKKGIPNSRKGIRFTDEQCLRNPNCKAVIDLTTNIEYFSSGDASRKTGIPSGRIRNQCRIPTKNSRFRYKEKN